ncbi:hypothetical protein [Eubacterium ruminantium]|uniref:hypothetical protein n=1 Tax=Eubacterium ruminantium TaxID=42322 RepID=UPI0024792F43|nr:hypothetical protein [Eubacterium ruminantium]
MLKFESNDGFSKIVLWDNEVPFDYDSHKKKKMIIDAGKNVWHEGTICMEAKLNPRHASNYAMICMKYTYTQSKKTDIIIHYGNYHKDKKNGLFNKNAFVGLDDFFAKTIYEIFSELPSDIIPCGVIEVIGGAYDEVGSSFMSFKCIIELMIWIFSNYNRISEDSLGDEILNRIYDCQYFKANKSKSYHHPEPEITLCEAESFYEGEGSELR